jgi:hypothetical protein
MGPLQPLMSRVARAWNEGGLRAVWSRASSRFYERWAQWWLARASLSRFGRIATRLAVAVPLSYLEYYEQQGLARLSTFGFVAPSARCTIAT